MKIKVESVFVLFIFLLLISCSTNKVTSKKASIISKQKNNNLIILDTVTLIEPVLLTFEKDIQKQYVIIEKNKLTNVNKKENNDLKTFISSHGAILLIAVRFENMLSIGNNRYGLESLDDVKTLKRQIIGARNDVIVKPNSKKIFNNWKYEDVYPKKFLLCLIKGKEQHFRYAACNNAITGFDNLYIKFLVPITW